MGGVGGGQNYFQTCCEFTIAVWFANATSPWADANFLSPRFCRVDLGWTFYLVWRIWGRLPANFSANLSEIFPQIFQPCFSSVSGPSQQFTPKIFGILLQFHFLKPKNYSRRFSACWGDQNSWILQAVLLCQQHQGVAIWGRSGNTTVIHYILRSRHIFIAGRMDNFTKIRANFHDTLGGETEKMFTPHFCRVVVLTCLPWFLSPTCKEGRSGNHQNALLWVLFCPPSWGQEICAFLLCMSMTCLKRGKSFYLQLELFCLQLSFFAYSPLRPLLDALSHWKQKSSNCKSKSENCK